MKPTIFWCCNSHKRVLCNRGSLCAYAEGHSGFKALLTKHGVPEQVHHFDALCKARQATDQIRGQSLCADFHASQAVEAATRACKLAVLHRVQVSSTSRRTVHQEGACWKPFGNRQPCKPSLHHLDLCAVLLGVQVPVHICLCWQHGCNHRGPAQQRRHVNGHHTIMEMHT